MNPVNLEDGRLQLASRLKDQRIALFVDDVWGRYAPLAINFHSSLYETSSEICLFLEVSEALALQGQVASTTKSQSCRVNKKMVYMLSRELMDILPDNLLSILAPGSCVVTTSRCDEYVLPDCAVHDLALLSSSEARLVFCHHAGIDKLSMETALEDANLPEEQKEWMKRITAVVTKCSGEPSSGSTC